MPLYESVEHILKTTERDDVYNKLIELGEKPHHKAGHQKLAELLFEKTSGEKTLKDSGIKVEEAPKKDVWAELAQEIKKESRSIKKDKPDELKTYICRNHNHSFPCVGDCRGENEKVFTKKRYVAGVSTLEIEEQIALEATINLERIKFRGVSEPYVMNGFEGRGVLQTKDPLLQEFLETNKDYGTKYIQYDQSEIQRKAQEEDMKITLLKAGIYEAEDKDLIATLSFLDMKKGSNSFDILQNRTQRGGLVQKALRYAEHSPDDFLRAMESKASKVVYLVNLAKAYGYITVTSDETEVKWADNHKTFCKSSRASDWQMDVVDFLTTSEGYDVGRKLQTMVGYTII